MTSFTRYLRSVRLAILALGLLAPLALPVAAREAYSPASGAASDPAPASYQFLPGSNHLHRVATTPVQAAAAPTGSGARYEFLPGSNHRHIVQ